MLETILTYSTETTITLIDALISIMVSFGVGGLISLTYMKTHDDTHSQNFALTIVLLPAVIAGIIMLIGSDIAKAFSLAGAFSIIRFRSAPGDPKDIAFVLFAMASGLAAGVGLWQFGIIFAASLCVVMYGLNKVGFAQVSDPLKRLKITVPEDLEYNHIFTEVFNEFTKEFNLIQVKTTAMGSLLTLTYSIRLKNESMIQDFIDQLRIRNGNLNISLDLINKGTY